MSAATDAWPLNLAFLARGSSSRPEPLEAALEAGAAGLKIHEDVGAHRTALDTAVTVAEAYDVQVAVHTDGLNECLSVDDTLDVLAGRTIHAFHIEGCGGGHAPDVLRLLGEPNIIASSTNPTIPFGVHAVAEHVPMVRAVHALRRRVPGRRRDRPRPRAGGDDGRRGRAARPRADRDHVVRLAGHGPRRRDRAADVPARVEDARRARRRAARTTTSACCATWPSARSTPRWRTAWRTRSVRSRRAGWPTSCCGARSGSASSPRWC